MPFLAANVVGVFVKRRLMKESIVTSFQAIKRMRILPSLFKGVLLIIICLAVLFPSHRWDNNHMMVDPTYMPIPQKNPLTIAFFQIGDSKYIRRTVPDSTLTVPDWYFTHKEAFGGANTILGAAIRRPRVFLMNILDNVKPLLEVPVNFIIGVPRPFFVAVSIVLLPIGLFGMFRRLKDEQEIPLIFSIIFGSIASIAGLLLIWVNPRFVITLLPVGLLVVSHIGSGIIDLVNFIKFIPSNIKQFAQKNLTTTNALIVSLSAICILYTSPYPHGRRAQAEALFNNKAFLSGAEACCMTVSHKELCAGLDEKTKILAFEDLWIKAFTNVDLDGAYQVLSLPPFPDASGKTQSSLGDLDVIWVNDFWSTERRWLSTQLFLRYQLHVEPFLKKALAKGWSVQDLKGYGKVYKRPNL